ncbi:MAG: type II toxin-antitoxin system RelE/ParE family toxin [Bacteroidetes bacterium]|nr:type II toxin-antitoxin system RelE/ParE family toxin [Bacteroidota bacterium]
MKIIWSSSAEKTLDDISVYYLNSYGVNYGKKLINRIIDAVEIIKDNVQIGKRTSRANVRFIIRGNYSIYYRVSKSDILILTIWDNRRNPKQFKI